jgi:hypothetical protein
MKLGSPKRAMSVLLDKGARVFSPAVGLGTVWRLEAGHLPTLLLRLSGCTLGSTSGVLVRLGSLTGTESGNFSVSHRKYREAHGRVGSELERGVLRFKLIIFSSRGTKASHT